MPMQADQLHDFFDKKTIRKYNDWIVQHVINTDLCDLCNHINQ